MARYRKWHSVWETHGGKHLGGCVSCMNLRTKPYGQCVANGKRWIIDDQKADPMRPGHSSRICKDWKARSRKGEE